MLSLHQHSLLSLLRLQNYKKIRLHTNKIATIVLYGVNNFIILSPGALFFAFSASPTGSFYGCFHLISPREAIIMPHRAATIRRFFTHAAFSYILYV